MANGDDLYKKDIRNISNMQQLASVVNQMQPIIYKENRPDAVDDFLGFRVMDVAAIDERLVERNSDGDPDTVRDINMIPILVGTIKYIKTLLDDYEDRISALESP